MRAQVLSYWRGLDKTQRFWVGVAAGATMSMLSALLASSLESQLGVRAPSMSFLCSVILAALWFGRRVALVTAVFDILAYNFYLVEPRNTLAFAGFDDVLTLLVFVSVAFLIGGFAGTMHDERERARDQLRVLSGLFTVSRAMGECANRNEAMALLATGAREVVADQAAVYGEEGEGVVVLAHTARDGDAPPREVEVAVARLMNDPMAKTAESGWRLEPVDASGKRVAVLAWAPSNMVRGAEQTIAVRLLAELASVAIERAQTVQRQVEMDTMTATERLRTALLSSISHDFRTPLSTILTSASSLRAYGDQFSPSTRADLLITIEEEAERLNSFVRNILDMTRLEANVVKPRVEWIDPLEAIDAVQRRMNKRLSGGQLDIVTPAAVPAIRVDPLLFEQAIVNVIDNALVHASGAVVRIGADYTEDTVRLWVEDEGPGVPQSDLLRIFDKFHRLDSTRNIQGAGLGLAITKGFIEAMQGEIKAASPVQNGRGLRIEFVFPLQTHLVGA